MSLNLASRIRRFAYSLGMRLVRFGIGGNQPGAVRPESSYAERVREEIERFRSVENVHDLPEIFHFWSNRYVRPKLESVLGVSGFDELCILYASRYSSDHPGKPVEIFSLGAGNCDTEVRIGRKLLEHGLTRFKFFCLDLNGDMLARGRELAAQQGVADHFEFLEIDLTQWHPEREAAIVIAHHSLHHFVELEATFDRVREAIGDTGYFLVNDMVGRNGHMRWPEALTVIQDIWKTMPDRYKYNHQLCRFEQEFDNWDCSKEGFEGIRAQDILPLLVKMFYFESFVAYGNLPDIFVDRSFRHNFDPGNTEDTEFVDRIGALNDRLISEGAIKPTQIMAVMRAKPGVPQRCYQHWTAEFCVRSVELVV